MGVSERPPLPGNMERFAVTVAAVVIFMAAVITCHPSPQLNFQSPRRGRTPNAKGDFSFTNEEQSARQARSESGFDTESVEGSYSFTSPEGRSFAVSYTADRNGYFPRGSGIHPALLMALEHLRKVNGI